MVKFSKTNLRVVRLILVGKGRAKYFFGSTLPSYSYYM